MASDKPFLFTTDLRDYTRDLLTEDLLTETQHGRYIPPSLFSASASASQAEPFTPYDFFVDNTQSWSRPHASSSLNAPQTEQFELDDDDDDDDIFTPDMLQPQASSSYAPQLAQNPTEKRRKTEPSASLQLLEERDAELKKAERSQKAESLTSGAAAYPSHSPQNRTTQSLKVKLLIAELRKALQEQSREIKDPLQEKQSREIKKALKSELLKVLQLQKALEQEEKLIRMLQKAPNRKDTSNIKMKLNIASDQVELLLKQQEEEQNALEGRAREEKLKKAVQVADELEAQKALEGRAREEKLKKAVQVADELEAQKAQEARAREKAQKAQKAPETREAFSSPGQPGGYQFMHSVYFNHCF